MKILHIWAGIILVIAACLINRYYTKISIDTASLIWAIFLATGLTLFCKGIEGDK